MICKITHTECIEGYGEFLFCRNESYDITSLHIKGYFVIKIDTCIYKSFLNMDYFYTLSESRDNKINTILS